MTNNNTVKLLYHLEYSRRFHKWLSIHRTHKQLSRDVGSVTMRIDSKHM